LRAGWSPPVELPANGRSALGSRNDPALSLRRAYVIRAFPIRAATAVAMLFAWLGIVAGLAIGAVTTVTPAAARRDD